MEESAAAKAYRFPRTRKMTLDENWLYFGGGLFAFSQVGALLMMGNDGYLVAARHGKSSRA